MSMTRTGTVMGTPYYMSPEQAKGAGGVTHQSDLYSMGVIAFEAVTGQVPFDGNSFNDLMFKIVLGEAPNLRELVPGIDPAFVAIVERAMKRDLAERFESAEQFIAALDSWRPRGRTVPDGTPVRPELFASMASEAEPKRASPTNLDWAASQAITGTSKKAPLLPAFITAGAVLAVALGGLVWWSTSGSDGDPEEESPVVAAEPLEPESPAGETVAPAVATEEAKADAPAPPPEEKSAPAEDPEAKPENADADEAKDAGKQVEPAPPKQAAPTPTPPRPRPSAPSRPAPKAKPGVPDFGY